MTTNKPEVVGFVWSFRQAREVVAASSTFVNQLRNDGVDLEPLILISDYETLQAECEKLRNGLKNARYRIEQGRIWNGMGWTLTGLHAHQQQRVIDALDAAIQEYNP